MSALLDAVEMARERRDALRAEYDQAEQAFRETLRRACETHSLRVVARAAGLSHNGVRYLLDRKGK